MTKEDRFIRRIPAFYAFAAIFLLMGLMGLLLGTWVELYRHSTQGELMVNKSLMMFSLGACISAIIHISSLRAIKRLAKKNS